MRKEIFSFRSFVERFAYGVTFTVMAGLVPAIGRGTLPLRMAGTSPAMTVRTGFIQAGRALPAGVELAMTREQGRHATQRHTHPDHSHRQPAAAGVAGAAVYRQGARRAGRRAACRSRPRGAGRHRCASSAMPASTSATMASSSARRSSFMSARRMSGFGGSLDASAARRRGALSRVQGRAWQRDQANTCRSAAATTCRPRSATSAISTAPRSTPNARDFRATLDRLGNPFVEPFLTAPSPGIVAAALRNDHYPTRKPISPRSARRCGSNTRPSSTTASCCSSTARISRWNGICPTRTSRWATSWASSIAWSRPSIPRCQRPARQRPAACVLGQL